MPLFWRVFATNASALTVAAVVLVISPATVSFPVAATEAVVLALGLAVLLFINWGLLRRAFGPLARLTRFMATVDPLVPGRRATVESRDPEVAALTEAFNDMVDRLESERRESARRASAAQEEERLRIARDLHDEVGQSLTGAMLLLQRADRVEGQAARAATAEARESVRAVLEEVRHIARRLRPEALDHLGLASALSALTSEMSRQSGVEVTRRIDKDLPRLAPEKELAIYRVAQEALTNVARHAEANAAELALACRDGALVLSVHDDGCGIAGAPDVGSGIRGMRERAVMAGADLDVAPSASGGTAVTLVVPVTDAGA